MDWKESLLDSLSGEIVKVEKKQYDVAEIQLRWSNKDLKKVSFLGRWFSNGDKWIFDLEHDLDCMNAKQSEEKLIDSYRELVEALWEYSITMYTEYLNTSEWFDGLEEVVDRRYD
jgi:hypothetical protein